MGLLLASLWLDCHFGLLRKKLQNDAESMELLWTYASLNDDFAKRIKFEHQCLSHEDVCESGAAYQGPPLSVACLMLRTMNVIP